MIYGCGHDHTDPPELAEQFAGDTAECPNCILGITKPLSAYERADAEARENQKRLEVELGIYEVIQFCYGPYEELLARFSTAEAQS